MKSLFHYEDMFCTEGMHYMIHNRCENFENILFFVQTQDDNIFGGFTFGSLKKNTKSSDIFLWVD